LAPALKGYAEGFARRTGIQVNLDLPQDLRRLPREAETAFSHEPLKHPSEIAVAAEQTSLSCKFANPCCFGKLFRCLLNFES
jgi:hypothetical protein